MRKKSVVSLLAFLSVLGFTLGIGSCNSSNNNEQDPVEISVDGFDVQESINVNVGALVELEKPIVTDSLGVLLDCWTYVTDANGNYVATTANSFTADNIGVYTITYVVRDSANNTYEKKTIVNVQGEEVVGEVTIKVDFEQFIVVGETISIDAVCSNADAELVYNVKKCSTGEEVTVDSAQFIAQKAGLYEVNVSTANGAATYKYNVFAENPMQEGEVEKFDEAWEEKETFIGGKRQDWEIVTSEECGIVDPYGRQATFAKYSTERAYIPLYIDIRENASYYESLADQGYTHVSMWIYMQSEKPHITISDRDPNGGFYRHSGPDLYPGEWTEFRLDLITGKTTWYRSFVQCYSYYENQNHFYLQVDNSDEWNTWGGGDSITFYFTDIFAVKDVAIPTATEVETQKEVKNTVDVSSYFVANFNLDYSVSYRGNKVALENSEYVFTANGEYILEAVPADFNLRGSAKVTLQVSDDKILNCDYLAKERTTDSVTVSLSELNAAFAATSTTAPAIESYKVFYNGEEIFVTDNAFTASQDGQYTVEIEGSYEETGVVYKTYHTVSLDVWSEETRYMVLDSKNIRCIRAWDWDNSQTTATYGEYSVGGKLGNYVKATAKGQSLTLYAGTLYSKTYYETIHEQYSDMKVLIDVYYEVGAEGKTTNFRSFYHANKAEWFDKYNDQWQTYEISLADFISLYDEINGKYEEYKSATVGANTDGYQGTWLQLIGSQVARTAYMSVSLKVEATEATATLKNGAALSLDTNNDLRELLDVTLDGVKGEILSAEIYFNNEWIALENCKFNPAWEVNYQFRLNVQTLNTLKYKQVELTLSVGDGAFTAMNDNGFYQVKIGETFDASTLLSSDYTYRVKLTRYVNGKQTLVKECATAQIDTTELSAGMYVLNIYATRGDKAFAEILYYTLNLDVWSEEMKYEVLDMDNKRAMRAYDWGSTSYKLDYGEYEVGGKTDNFVRSESNSGSQSLVIYAKPLYSKAYYEWLLSENEALDVTMNFYHTPTTEGKRTSFWSVFSSYVLFTDDTNNNTWQTFTLPLEDFISNYDALVTKYEAKKDASEADGESGSERDAWVYITDNGAGHIVYFNVAIKQRPMEATQATVSLKEGASLATDTDNNLSELLNVTLDGEAGEIASTEIYFNNEWIALENNLFNPVWELSYKFRFNVQTANGLKYKQVEVTLPVGEGTFTATNDTKFYGVKAGESFNASDILSENYNYRVKLMRGANGVMTLVGEYDAAEINTANLSVGMYLLNVYATREGDKFSEILYYTLTLDVWSDDAKYEVLDTENMVALRAWTWGSTVFELDYGEYEVGGKTDNFIRSQSNSGSQSLVIYAKPLYSKAYYEWLLSENEELDVTMNLYHIPGAANGTTNFWSVFTSDKISFTDTDHNNQWLTYKMTLANFITKYDVLADKYEAKKNATEADGGTGNATAWIYITGGGLAHTVYFNTSIVERPIAWSAETLTMDMLTTYQYDSSQNCVYTSITTEIPEGGVAGTYIKWAQEQKGKEDVQVAVTPAYGKEYYKALLASGKNYKITYDVYIEVTTEGCECTELELKLWKKTSDGTDTYGAIGKKIAVGAWHTVEIDLQYLVANWGNYRLFGLNFCNQKNLERGKDFITFYLGNIQIAEGVASGVATLKNA